MFSSNLEFPQGRVLGALVLGIMGLVAMAAPTVAASAGWAIGNGWIGTGFVNLYKWKKEACSLSLTNTVTN